MKLKFNLVNQFLATIFFIVVGGSVAAQSTTPVTTNPVSNDIKKLKPVVNTQIGSTVQPEQPASARIMDGREPAELVGYITWVDPVSQKKHLLRGQNINTGDWEILDRVGSVLRVYFKNVSTNETFQVSLVSGPYFTAIDSAGNDVRRLNSRVAWDPNQLPAGFRYRILFVFDLNYNGLPVPYEATDRTIRYNPEIWKFYDLVVTTTLNNIPNQEPGYNVHLEDFPQRPIEVKKRAINFTDLPDLKNWAIKN